MKLLKNVVAKNVRESTFHHNQNIHRTNSRNYESSKTDNGNILLIIGSGGAFFIVLALVALFLVQKRPGKRTTRTAQPERKDYRPLSLKDTYEKGVKPILKFVGSKDHRESPVQNSKLNDEISGVLKLQEKYKRPIETALAAGSHSQEYRKSSDASEYVLSALRPTQMCDGRKRNGSSSCLLPSPQRTDLPRKGIIRPKGSLESEKCRVVQAPEGADFSVKRKKVKLSLPGFKSSIQQQSQPGPTANNLGAGGTLVRQNRPPPLTLSEYYQQEQKDLPIEPTLPILPDIDRLPVEKPSLKIGLSYDKDKNELKIVLTSASNLPDRLLPPGQRKGDSATTSCCSTESDKMESGSSSTSNQQIVLEPFVKVKFLPEKQQRYKSKIVKGTLNPIFDETFMFKNVSISQLQSSTIHFSVLSSDKYSTDDDLVGEAICSLNSVDLSQSNKKVALNLTLLNPSFKFQSSANRGDFLVSLCYSPSARKITVVLLKARNLPALDSSGCADPQVKISMYYNNDVLLKQKSRVVRRTLDPTFNETFDFPLTALSATVSPSNGAQIFRAAAAAAAAAATTTTEKSAAPDNLSFDFEIFNHDRMKKSQFLGHVIIGGGRGAVLRKTGNTTNSNDKEHLDEIFRRPLKQITQWHRLKA